MMAYVPVDFLYTAPPARPKVQPTKKPAPPKRVVPPKKTAVKKKVSRKKKPAAAKRSGIARKADVVYSDIRSSFLGSILKRLL